jgi:DNA-binding CsgD family transcriptional regulator
MQAQLARRSNASKPDRGGRPSKWLLVGSEHVFTGEVTRRILSDHPFRGALRSTALLDALSRPESGGFDLVLMSHEFREEELSLFSFDAQRRGFSGLILHVASVAGEARGANLPGSRGLSVGRFDQKSRNGELQELSERSGDQNQTSALRMTLGVQTRQKANGTPDFVSLASKERAVLTGVSKGWTNRQIARDLKCSEGSVKSTIQRVFTKLGVKNRARIQEITPTNTLMEPQGCASVRD